MATAIVREYADVSQTSRAQAPLEPCLATQALTTSASSVASAAFNSSTRLIAIATAAAQAHAVEFSATPGATTAATTSSLRLPANSLLFFAVRPGDKVSLIDVT